MRCAAFSPLPVLAQGLPAGGASRQAAAHAGILPGICATSGSGTCSAVSRRHVLHTECAAGMMLAHRAALHIQLRPCRVGGVTVLCLQQWWCCAAAAWRRRRAAAASCRAMRMTVVVRLPLRGGVTRPPPATTRPRRRRPGARRQGARRRWARPPVPRAGVPRWVAWWQKCPTGRTPTCTGHAVLACPSLPSRAGQLQVHPRPPLANHPAPPACCATGDGMRSPRSPLFTRPHRACAPLRPQSCRSTASAAPRCCPRAATSGAAAGGPPSPWPSQTCKGGEGWPSGREAGPT